MPLQIQGALNTVNLAVEMSPEITEQEPNNSAAQAEAVSLPVTINGHISGKDANGAADEDYFRFHARKGLRLKIEVAASRLGSPLDSQIEILDTKGDAIPRATVRCLYETYVTLSDKDSRRPELRMVSTSGFHEGDYLMVGDELDRITPFRISPMPTCPCAAPTVCAGPFSEPRPTRTRSTYRSTASRFCLRTPNFLRTVCRFTI